MSLELSRFEQIVNSQEMINMMVEKEVEKRLKNRDEVTPTTILDIEDHHKEVAMALLDKINIVDSENKKLKESIVKQEKELIAKHEKELEHIENYILNLENRHKASLEQKDSEFKLMQDLEKKKIEDLKKAPTESKNKGFLKGVFNA
jgi:hypothetical protein